MYSFFFLRCLFALSCQIFVRAVRTLTAFLHSCQSVCGFNANKMVKADHLYVCSRVLKSDPGYLDLAQG